MNWLPFALLAGVVSAAVTLYRNPPNKEVRSGTRRNDQ